MSLWLVNHRYFWCATRREIPKDIHAALETTTAHSNSHHYHCSNQLRKNVSIVVHHGRIVVVGIYYFLSGQISAVMAQREETTSIFHTTPAVGNNPTIGARFESRGGHPLAQVTCDLLRVALRPLGYRFSRAIGQSDRAHRMASPDYIDVLVGCLGRVMGL